MMAGCVKPYKTEQELTFMNGEIFMSTYGWYGGGIVWMYNDVSVTENKLDSTCKSRKIECDSFMRLYSHYLKTN